MQDKFRLYRRPNGMFYAEEYQTRHRESLQTKDEAEARRLITAKNQAATQPVFNLEMAKVYLKAHVQPVIAKKGWPKIRYGHCRAITREEPSAFWRSPSDRTTGTSLSCFGKPAVLRRILRVSRLTILICEIDGCTTNGRSWNHVVRVGLVWPSVAVSKAS
jgi:hypothetical protein